MSKLSSFLDDVDGPEETSDEEKPKDVIATTRAQLKRAGINPPESERIIEEELNGEPEPEPEPEDEQVTREETQPKRGRGRPPGSTNKPKTQSLQPTPKVRAERDTEAAPPPEGAEANEELLGGLIPEPLTHLKQALARLEHAGWDVTIKLRRRK